MLSWLDKHCVIEGFPSVACEVVEAVRRRRLNVGVKKQRRTMAVWTRASPCLAGVLLCDASHGAVSLAIRFSDLDQLSGNATLLR